MTRGLTEEEDGWGAARAKRRCGVARSPQPFFRDPLYFSDDLFRNDLLTLLPLLHFPTSDAGSSKVFNLLNLYPQGTSELIIMKKKINGTLAFVTLLAIIRLQA
jgi:hypothetical protein